LCIIIKNYKLIILIDVLNLIIVVLVIILLGVLLKDNEYIAESNIVSECNTIKNRILNINNKYINHCKDNCYNKICNCKLEDPNIKDRIKKKCIRDCSQTKSSECQEPCNYQILDFNNDACKNNFLKFNKYDSL